MLNRRRDIPKNFGQQSLHEEAVQQKHSPIDASQVKGPTVPEQTLVEPALATRPTPQRRQRKQSVATEGPLVDVRVRVPKTTRALSSLPEELRGKALQGLAERARKRLAELSDFQLAGHPPGECFVVRSAWKVDPAQLVLIRKKHDPLQMLGDAALLKAVLQHNLNVVLDSIG